MLCLLGCSVVPSVLSPYLLISNIALNLCVFVYVWCVLFSILTPGCTVTYALQLGTYHTVKYPKLGKNDNIMGNFKVLCNELMGYFVVNYLGVVVVSVVLSG